MIKIIEYMASGKPIVQFETTEGKASAGAAAIYVTNNDEVEFEAALMFEGTCESQIGKTEVGIHFFESHNFLLKG